MNPPIEPAFHEVVVCELPLPLPINKGLVQLTKALTRMHGKNIFMRHVGEKLQIYKPVVPPNDKLKNATTILL